MSLSVRLLGAWALLLVAALAAVTVLQGLRGVARIGAETDAAMAVGWATASRAVVALPEPRRTREQLREIVRLFDGDRHVSALMLDPAGKPIAASVPARRAAPAPAWFAGLVPVAERPMRFELANLGAIVLSPEPGHAVDALWSDLVFTAGALVAFAASGAALIAVALRNVVRPLRRLGEAVDRLAAGDRAVRVVPEGPAETVRLAGRFNGLAERLAESRLRTARLAAQLTAAHDEERAALARDLHDDVGPLLFAIDVDVTAIRSLINDAASPARDGAIAERAVAIRDAANAVKKQVRGLLGQLRPGVVAQIGLAQAIQDLTAFWRERHPGVAFAVSVPSDGFGGDVDGTLNTVVREAVNNALKHGRPSRIDIEIAVRDGMIRLKVADDGGGLDTGRGKGGFGIVGMRERIAALGGRLAVDQRVDVAGVTVSAAIPLAVLPGRTADTHLEEEA